MSIDMQVGNAAIKAFKRLPYQPWYALAEYIDNATQSFKDHNSELDNDCVTVSIVFDASQRTISIVDDAFGMGEKELEHALTVGKPPVDPSGRSRYGMGMKTASCWFGDEWSISTKKVGEEKEYLIAKGKHISVQEGDQVIPGDALMSGVNNPHDLLDLNT